MIQWNTLVHTVATAIATGTTQALWPFLASSVEVRTNFAGYGRGAEGVELLCCPAARWPLCKLNVESLLFNDTQATFDVLALHAVGRGTPHFHFVQYGLRCALKLSENHITAITMELRWSDGNTEILSPWLPLAHCLTADDGVQAPAADDDSQAIRSVIAQFAWDLDFGGEGCKAQLLPEVRTVDPYHGGTFCGAENWLRAIANDLDREAFLQHTLRIFQIQTDGTTAYVTAGRMEPNRIGSRSISMDNYFADWFTAIYAFSLEQCSGRWMISALTITKKILQIPALENMM